MDPVTLGMARAYAKQNFSPLTWVLPILGQSNAVGAALDRDPAIDTLDGRVRQYARSGPDAGKIIPATEPLKNPQGNTDFGWGMPLAKLMLAKLPEGSDIILVPCGWSGTTIMPGSSPYDTNCWRTTFTPPTGGRNLTIDSADAINTVLAASGGRLLGLFWLQGESDGVIGTSKSTYITEFDLIIDYFRTNVGGGESAPFVIGGMNPDAFPTVAGRVPINEAHQETPARKEFTGFAPGVSGASRIHPSPTVDTTHYNATGMRALARNYADAYDRAKSNVKGTIPSVPTNLAINDSGVTWDAASGRVTGYGLELSVNGTTSTPTTIVPAYPIPLGDTDSATVRVYGISEGGVGRSAYAERIRSITEPEVDPLEGLAFDRAYSLRRAISAFEGPLFQVRRSSDNATQDCASVADAILFVGSDSGYITTWYDQSGHNRNLIQSTAAAQPRLINAGVVEQNGTRPAVRFDGSDDYLTSASAGMFAAGAASVVSVQRILSTHTSQPMFGEYSSSSDNTIYELCSYASGYTLGHFIRNDAATTLLANFSSDVAPDAWLTTPTMFSVIDSGSALAKRVNKTDLASNPTPYTRSGATTPTRFAVGARHRTSATAFWQGYVSELLISYDDWDTTTRDTIENAVASYYGIG